MLAIREAMGPDISLRADANRRWSLDDAKEFADHVSNANLEVHPLDPCIQYTQAYPRPPLNTDSANTLASEPISIHPLAKFVQTHLCGSSQTTYIKCNLSQI